MKTLYALLVCAIFVILPSCKKECCTCAPNNQTCEETSDKKISDKIGYHDEHPYGYGDFFYNLGSNTIVEQAFSLVCNNGTEPLPIFFSGPSNSVAINSSTLASALVGYNGKQVYFLFAATQERLQSEPLPPGWVKSVTPVKTKFVLNTLDPNFQFVHTNGWCVEVGQFAQDFSGITENANKMTFLFSKKQN